ncbi:hypothetical protein SAMN05444671_4634 [Flavobacterium sp. CF108]|uniref:hypothetical protein n=1 Tax=unclassified Flavobacterium TaxID=196869 RepID=UPI0008D1B632|nr:MULTISPECIES: hypothetical protein [unclassified Flavobacterium]SEP22781.1 hypothetical protein SAMN04487978_0123 [Flavobacterium sp. fv08]SHI00102.1 hypothetical protein SAMN05444671_4634 [Flavobacterium sp. CF108]
MQTEYSFREVVNKRAYSVRIVFDIDRFNYEERKLDNYDFVYSADDRWRLTCEFAVKLFFQSFGTKLIEERVIIKIPFIDWDPFHTVDTIVLYSVIKGLSEAFNLNSDEFEFNIEDRKICLPLI